MSWHCSILVILSEPSEGRGSPYGNGLGVTYEDGAGGGGWNR